MLYVCSLLFSKSTKTEVPHPQQIPIPLQLFENKTGIRLILFPNGRLNVRPNSEQLAAEKQDKLRERGLDISNEDVKEKQLKRDDAMRRNESAMQLKKAEAKVERDAGSKN